MDKILITGAAGFIGSHLCDFFLKRQFKVIGIDNFLTGDYRNIEHLENEQNFTFLKHDIQDPIFIKGDIQYILHFASPASPIDYLKIPIETLMIGSIGTKNILDLANQKKSRILIASTSEVYGDPEIHPQRESYFGNVNPIGPRSCYDEAKRFQEALTFAYHRKFDLDIRTVRIFNTYGPRMRLNDGRVVPTFIGQILNEQDLSVFGDGSQTRSFCYVDDLVQGISKILFSDYKLPINLGNPEEITILEFARELIELTDSDRNIIYEDLPKDDPKQRKPDIKLAKEVLNWFPKTPRKEGLLKTLNYFSSLKDKNIEPKKFNN